jgi:hypothetical protein
MMTRLGMTRLGMTRLGMTRVGMNRVGVAAVLLTYGAAMGVASAANLSKGVYGVSSYYVSATGSGGGTCIFPAGTYLSSEYAYPGANKTGATARTYVNSASGAYVFLTTYPTTPANGATMWSGNVTSTFLPGGTAATGTFSATIATVDTDSYVAKTTFNFPSGSGTCTSVVQEVGVLQAK